MADVKINCRPNGPYLVQGTIEIVDSQGQPVTIDPAKGTYALCRCGLSASKPFCDGTHSRQGWTE